MFITGQFHTITNVVLEGIIGHMGFDPCNGVTCLWKGDWRTSTRVQDNSTGEGDRPMGDLGRKGSCSGAPGELH